MRMRIDKLVMAEQVLGLDLKEEAAELAPHEDAERQADHDGAGFGFRF